VRANTCLGLSSVAVRPPRCAASRREQFPGEQAPTILTQAHRKDTEHHGVPKYRAIAHYLLGKIAGVMGDWNAAEEQLTGSAEPAPGTHRSMLPLQPLRIGCWSTTFLLKRLHWITNLRRR